jgi:hypothetical protein
MRESWCIVVADNPSSAKATDGVHEPIPEQYCRLGSGVSPLHRSIRRAARIAPISQILITALEEHRRHWEPAIWFARPESRFIGDHRSVLPLSSAAAILSVAARSPSNLITVLPGRCYVAHEEILQCALRRAISALPEIPEGIVTLGMLDAEEGLDEDYLVVRRARTGLGLQVDGFARRPVAWVARHLKHHGALVASGIMIGYAGAFASHVSRHWPALSIQLEHLAQAATDAGKECAISASLTRHVSPAVLHSLRWHPPACRQRVLGVCRSGWSGLKSSQSFARAIRFSSIESPMLIASGAATGRLRHRLADGSSRSADSRSRADPEAPARS